MERMKITKKEKSNICIKVIEEFLENTEHSPVVDLAFSELKENLNSYLRYLDKCKERRKRSEFNKREKIKKFSEGTLCV